MKVLRNISVAEVTEVCGMRCVHSNSLRLLNNDHWAFKMDILYNIYNIGNTRMTSFTSNETAMTPFFLPGDSISRLFMAPNTITLSVVFADLVCYIESSGDTASLSRSSKIYL